MSQGRPTAGMHRGLDTRRLVVFAYLLALATLVAVGGFSASEWRSATLRRDDALATATLHARQMADVVSRQMDAVIQGVDLVLLQLREDYRHGGEGEFDLAARVTTDTLQDHGIQGVILIDGAGKVSYSSMSPAQKGVYLGDRDYFLDCAKGLDRVVVGKPVRSRLLQSWSFVVARPRFEAGRFVGAVVIGLTPESFARHLVDPRLTDHDVVAVFHTDGTYLARNRALDKVLGTKLSGDRPFTGLDAPPQGVVRIASPVDRRARIYAWQRVPHGGIVVTVGVDEETILAPVAAEDRRHTIQFAALATLLLALGSGLSLLLLRTAHQQRRLAESESRYRNAFEEDSSIKLVIDPNDGRLLDANDAAVKFYGYPRHALLGMRIAEFGEIAAQELTDFLAQASGAERKRFFLTQRLASGEMRYVEAYSGPIEVEGRPVLFSVIHDVTERHANEQRLKLAASMFAHTHEGIFYCDAEGRLLDVNDGFVQLTGFGRDEVLGRHMRFIDGGRHDDEFFSRIWASLGTNGNWHGEIWIRNKAGEVFVELLNLSAISDGDGTVSAYVGIFSDISSLKESESRFRLLAQSDALTGLPNRTLLLDRLNQALSAATRQPELLAVAFLDLDGFKPINDRHGHRVGDEVLIEVAQRLRQSVRAADTVCRLGGDEFVVLLRNLASIKEAQMIMDRARLALGRAYFCGDLRLDGVTASVGFACYPADGNEAEGLIAAADAAMYDSKRAGRNMVRRFTGDVVQATGSSAEKSSMAE